MTITPGLAVEFELLTQALDLPGTDVAETLVRLVGDAQSAVDSYLGLSVAIIANRSQFDLTVLDEGTQPEDIRASLLIPLSSAADASTIPTSVALMLYAATPGAFVDLAADLSWITGRALTDFRLDEHRTPPWSHSNPGPLGIMSTINQALGVLIGRGSIPEQAERDLYARAASAGIDPLGAATLILAALSPHDPELDPDPEPA
ncbi:MAG: hypothetical protein ACR2KJ_07055 [Jatrophihabitans sp.]